MKAGYLEKFLVTLYLLNRGIFNSKEYLLFRNFISAVIELLMQPETLILRPRQLATRIPAIFGMELTPLFANYLCPFCWSMSVQAALL